MKSVLGLNILLRNPIADTQQRRLVLNVPGFSFMFAVFLERNSSSWTLTFYRDARDVFMTAGNISGICYCLGGFLCTLFSCGLVKHIAGLNTYIKS
jgi:hypothetical protein